MDNGNGHAANDHGHVNGHVEPPRPIYYRTRGGGARVRYSPAARYPRCPCRVTYAYPNDLVLSLDDERRQLVNTNRALLQEVEELSVTVDAQGARIVELEETVVNEIARTEAARDEVWRVRGQLTRIVEEVRDRVSGILAGTSMLIDEVMDTVQSLVPEGTEEDPEENSKEEIPPDSPTVD